MEEVDITIPEWDPKPVKLWVVTIDEQPDQEDSHFKLYAADREVEVKRRMFNGEEVVDWDPESEDRAVLFDSCLEKLSRFAREILDEFIERRKPAEQINLYIVRDYFNMTFGIALTVDPERLSEHEGYAIEELSTVSNAMMKDMMSSTTPPYR